MKLYLHQSYIILNNFFPKGLIGSWGIGNLPVLSLTRFRSFLAIPFFLKIGLTKMYSTSPWSLNLTNPSVVFSFLKVKTPSAHLIYSLKNQNCS